MKSLVIFTFAFISTGILSCKKDDVIDPNLATVSTTAITGIGATSAMSGGNVTAQGFDSVTARGVCWSTSSNPTNADSKTVNGSGLGSFSSVLTSLTSNTTYYVRAYATNSKGTGYGSQVSFKTSNISGQSFSATIDATAWSTTNDYIYATVVDVLGTPTYSVRADHPTDGSYFAIPIKYFYGSDTTINFPAGISTVLLYYKSGKNWNQKTGSLHMVKSSSGGIETMTGTFSGQWKDSGSSATFNLTNGQFVAKRQL
jgi:hypothetical protein